MYFEVEFRVLSQEEEQDFRQWARENDPPRLDRWNIYHPVCREEWVLRGIKPVSMQYTI